MKKNILPLACVVAVILLAGIAQLFGVDLAALVSADPSAGMLAFAGMGSIEQIVKGIDKLEVSLRETKTTQTELADRMLQLEQRAAPAPFEHSKTGPSLGTMAVEAFQKNSELFGKTQKMRLELKAATDVISTTSGRTIVGGGVGSPGVPTMIGAHLAFPSRPQGSTSAVEYSRYTGVQGAAGVQAGEGVAKAAVRPDHTLITQGALTVAGYAKMSRQSLNDSNELRRTVDITLRRSVLSALDSALMAGNVTPAFDGLLTLATAYTSLVYTGMADAASEAVATMQTAGFMPDTIILSPADWLAVQVLKASGTGEYLSGSYLGPLPEALRGLKVVLSPSHTTGKCTVLDSSQIELIAVEDFTVEVGYENQDFTKNIVTLLGEMRVIPTFRATGAARLITPKA